MKCILVIFFTFALIFVIAGLAYMFFDDLLGCGNPIKYLRIRNTPSCKKCKHLADKQHTDRHYCTCPDVIEYHERVKSENVIEVRSDDVRGTKFCKFESNEEQDEQESASLKTKMNWTRRKKDGNDQMH